MKCLPDCNFSEMPNNTISLRRHMEMCSLDGPLKRIDNPDVVWRDGEFVVVEKAEDGEQTYNDDVRFAKPADTSVFEVLEEEPEEE